MDKPNISYNYLISYGFVKKPVDYHGRKYSDSGTGRIILTLKQKITIQSLGSVEELILKQLNETDGDIDSVLLYSFSLLTPLF